MEAIQLTSVVYASMIQHAYATLPEEAVGLLGGSIPRYASYAVSVRNVGGKRTFLVDPFAQFKAERQLANLGLDLVAVYHSHPGGGAQLSPLDLFFARRRSCVQLVIALNRPGLPGEEVRAYRIVDNVPVGLEILVGGS